VTGLNIAELLASAGARANHIIPASRLAPLWGHCVSVERAPGKGFGRNNCRAPFGPAMHRQAPSPSAFLNKTSLGPLHFALEFRIIGADFFPCSSKAYFMTTLFSALIDSASFNENGLSAAITEDWMQGRTTYGGLAAALCLETALRTFPDLPPLRSAMVSFIGPAGAAVEARAKILRQGKSVTFVEADLIAEKGLATRCIFVFGGDRQSAFNKSYSPRPALPGPDDCEEYIPDGHGPSFLEHFDRLLAKGARPMTGATEHDHFIWARHRDERATGVPAFLALADMPPPAVLPMFTGPAPLSSMTWQLNFLTENPMTQDRWWLLESRADYAGNGYTSQDMLIWNHGGDLVLAGRQSVAIFA